MVRKTLATALIVLALITPLAACTSSSGGNDPTKNPSTPSTPTSPSVSTAPTSSAPTTTPTTGTSSTPMQAEAALASYNAFTNAVNQAEQKPAQVANSLAAYGIDPALGTARGILTQFQVSNIEWRGTPPTSRTHIARVKLEATPYPTVTIVDCPTLSSSWRPYNTNTGKAVKTVEPKVAPPWATTATVALYKGKWKVQTEKTDMSRTCTP